MLKAFSVVFHYRSLFNEIPTVYFHYREPQQKLFGWRRRHQRAQNTKKENSHTQKRNVKYVKFTILWSISIDRLDLAATKGPIVYYVPGGGGGFGGGVQF